MLKVKKTKLDDKRENICWTALKKVMLRNGSKSFSADDFYDVSNCEDFKAISQKIASVVRQAAKKGWIVKSNRFILSQRRNQASKPIPLWRKA